MAITPPVMNTSVGGDNVRLDPALQPGAKPIPVTQPEPQAQPAPSGRKVGSWVDPHRGDMITGTLFGLNGPFQYVGQGTDVTQTNQDGSTVTGPASVPLAPSTDGATAAAAILRREENDGYRQTTAEWDVNAYRGGYGSSTITKADGTVVPITKGMVIDKADAERDLQRQIPLLNSQAAKRIGPAWNKLPGYTQGALMSVEYNYGTIPSSVVQAVQAWGSKGGSLNGVADTVEALGHRPGIQNPARRKRESDIIRGVGLQAGP